MLGSRLVSSVSDSESRAGDPDSLASDKWLFTAGHGSTEPKCNHIYFCKKKKIISTIKFTGHEIVIALLVPEWLSCIFGFIGFFFPLMAEDAFLHKEFVALTACPVGCLKSSEKRGDKEDRSGNHCGTGAGASRLKAKDFRKLRLFFGC